MCRANLAPSAAPGCAVRHGTSTGSGGGAGSAECCSSSAASQPRLGSWAINLAEEYTGTQSYECDLCLSLFACPPRLVLPAPKASIEAALPFALPGRYVARCEMDSSSKIEMAKLRIERNEPGKYIFWIIRDAHGRCFALRSRLIRLAVD